MTARVIGTRHLSSPRTISFRKAVYWLMRPAWRLLLRVLPDEDPWERFESNIPLRVYGQGAQHDFAWYFEGESAIDVKTLDELQDWLLECEYIRDVDLFHEPDFWQHPRTFERLRCGDCEDHALWAWRKLLELGFDADFVSGRCLPWQPGEKDGERGHAFILFKRDGQTFVFETVAKTKDEMVRPLAEARGDYRPEFGVDRARKRFAFNGLLLTAREREFGTRDSNAEPKRATA